VETDLAGLYLANQIQMYTTSNTNTKPTPRKVTSKSRITISRDSSELLVVDESPLIGPLTDKAVQDKKEILKSMTSCTSCGQVYTDPSLQTAFKISHMDSRQKTQDFTLAISEEKVSPSLDLNRKDHHL